MPGVMPDIHVLLRKKDVDGRDCAVDKIRVGIYLKKRGLHPRRDAGRCRFKAGVAL
jgi:hypothetical protein